MAMPGHHRVYPARRSRYQRRQLVAAASLIVLVVVVAVLAAWAHHSLSAARPASSHAARALPASESTPHSSTQPPSPPMREWLTKAEPSIDALFMAGSDAVALAAQGDIAATGAACHTAAGAAADLQQVLPSPDPALNTALQQALTDYQRGIRLCISGTQQQNAITIGEATVYTDRGNTDLQSAVDITECDLSSDARGPRVLTA